MAEQRKSLFFRIFVLAILYFLFLSIKAKNYEFLYYNLIMLIILTGIVIAGYGIHLRHSLFVGISVVALLHLAGGNVFTGGYPLYQTHLWIIPYDKIVHFSGSFIMALIFFGYLRSVLKEEFQNRTVVLGILAILLTIGMGSMVEVIEFLATLLFKTTLVGDYINNAGDLVTNTFGALAACFVRIRRMMRE